MPAIPAWAYPNVFDLTNPYSGNLSFNEQTASGIYLLIQDGCTFDLNVRSTSNDVPQADGSILHTRFLTGTTMQLTVQLWETRNEMACEGALLVEMLDNLSGSVRSLLNAGDNEGRLAWEVDGANERMLDDIRLSVYPVFTPGPPPTVTFTIDSQYPYAQDLTQQLTTFLDGVPNTITNNGTADYWPVFQVNRAAGVTSASAVNDFIIQNLTTGIDFVYSSSNPGASPISAGGHYAEMDNFRNTIFEDGDGANLSAGITELESDYFPLVTGDNTIVITGCDMDMLWAPAWG
jgi:hypothetical protein